MNQMIDVDLIASAVSEGLRVAYRPDEAPLPDSFREALSRLDRTLEPDDDAR